MNPRILHHKVVMVPHASLVSKTQSEVSNYSSLPAMFTSLHSSMNQKLFEKYICNQSSYYEIYTDGAAYPSYHLKLKYPLCQLCSHCYTAARIKNCLKSTSVIKIATIKYMDDLLCKGSHHVQPPNQQFNCQQR